jgi:hypothetical protein
VNRPVRRPKARSSDSIIRTVEVLPLVPVTCTTGKDCCGWPSRSTTAAMRASEGCRSCSGVPREDRLLDALEVSVTLPHHCRSCGSERGELRVDARQLGLRRLQPGPHLGHHRLRRLPDECLVAQLGLRLGLLLGRSRPVPLEPAPLRGDVDRAGEVELPP